MRKMALAVALLAVTGSSALADGMARRSVKDAPVAVVPTWDGTYVGIQIGGVWSDWSLSPAISNPGIGPFAAPGFPLGDFDGAGVTGGVHFGYKRQMGTFVGGFDVDWNWSSADDTGNFVAVGVPPGLPFSLKNSLRSYGTARLTGGVARDRTLLYATGGFAWGSSKASIDSPGQFAGPFSTSDHEMHIGWTAGAGAEFMISPQWTLGVEYKHIDLGNEKYTFTFPFAGGTPVTTKADIVLDEVTLRVSRKF